MKRKKKKTAQQTEFYILIEDLQKLELLQL